MTDRQTDRQTDRESSFELLRIFAMLIIIGHHLAVHGVMHGYATVFEDSMERLAAWMNGPKINQWFTCFLMPGGQVGVALFFMITGYFLIYNKKPARVHKLIYEGIFYAVAVILIAVIAYFAGFRYRYISLTDAAKNFLKSVFTVYDCYWFFAAYLVLCFLIPGITYFFNKYDQKGQFIILILFWAFGYGANVFCGGSYAGVFKAVFFFMLGGYIRQHYKNGSSRLSKSVLIILAAVSWLADSVVFYCIEAISCNGDDGLKNKVLLRLFGLVDYWILVPLCVISVFLLFAGMSFHNRYVNRIASTTFGVYLLHDSGITREIIWRGILNIDGDIYNSHLFIPYAIFSVAAIFTIGMVIDLMRQKFFTRISEKNWQWILSRLSRYRVI